MDRKTRIPLHYQILIALIVGSVTGFLVNPGDVVLPDQTRELTFAVDPGSGTDAWTLSVEDPENIETARKTYITADALAADRPRLAGLLSGRAHRQMNAVISITERRVRIINDGHGIVLQYSRHLGDQSMVTTHKAASSRTLSAELPQWSALYQQHGGGWRRRVAAWAKFIGDLFLRLLKMVTVPLIVTSLITGVAGLGNSKRLGAMFSKTMGYYVVTSMLAITTGLLMVNLVRPGVGAVLPGGGEAMTNTAEHSLGSIFEGLVHKMIPTNPVASLAGGEFLSIITFSILIGLFIIRTGGSSGETLRKFFNASFDVVMSLTMFIIRLAPIGVFAFMLFATATQGITIFKTLGWYMLTVFLALAFHAFVTLPLILTLIAKRSPWKFAQAMSPALMTAFSTASSNGTLPLTLSSVEQRAGVSNRISSFVLPLGATINMDGTALYEAVAVLFIAQATPGFAVGLESQIVVAITALLASVGAAGIPHAGLVMMAIVLQAVGLPLEAQGIILAVDRILDMCRTSVNVWSDSCGCAILEHLESNVVADAT